MEPSTEGALGPTSNLDPTAPSYRFEKEAAALGLASSRKHEKNVADVVPSFCSFS